MLLVKILMLYLTIMVLVYFLSDAVIYQPPVNSYDDNEDIIKLTSANGNKISALYLHNPTAKYTILFSHGNAEDLKFAFHRLRLYQHHGFSCFSFDYQGYGTSKGRPSEIKTYEDITAAYEYMVNQLKINPKNIIVAGHSLGSGPALELAITKEIGGLILESPFVTAFRVITQIPLFPIDKYRNNKKIKDINIPVLVVHGKKDRVIPFWHGQRIYELASEPKHKLWVDDAGHDDLIIVADDDYWQVMEKFMQDVSKLNEN